jgi:hypothetical protein
MSDRDFGEGGGTTIGRGADDIGGIGDLGSDIARFDRDDE